MKSNRIDLIGLKDCYFSLKLAVNDAKASQERLSETLLFCNKRLGFSESLNAASSLDKITTLYTDKIIKGDFINDN